MNDLYTIHECEHNIEAFLKAVDQKAGRGWDDFYQLLLQNWSDRLIVTTEEYIDRNGQSLPNSVEGNMWILRNPDLNEYRTVAALRWFCDDLEILTDDQLTALAATNEGVGYRWHNDLVTLYRKVELEIGWRDTMNTCDECGVDMRYAESPCHVDRVPF